MHTRSDSGFRRRLMPLGFAAACLTLIPASVQAITFVYVCLCCRQPGNEIVYKAGWINGDCDSLSAIPIVVDCDNLFTAFVLPGSGGVGTGYAPAFDRAVMLGTPIVGSDGVTVTRIVQGIYPASDQYTPGSSTYSTRLFAIREGEPGHPNQFAPIDISLVDLSPVADSMVISSVPGGIPVAGLFDMDPGPILAEGDVTIVVETYQAALACCPDNKCCFYITFADLAWQEAPPLPPACLGDSDRSGSVVFADVLTTLANFGNTYPVGVLTPGDAQGDRVVNFTDVLAILANFGNTCV